MEITRTIDEYEVINPVEKGVFVDPICLTVARSLTKEELLTLAVIRYYIKYGRMEYTWANNETIAASVNLKPEEVEKAINDMHNRGVISQKIKEETGNRIIYV